jgi:ABC-type sugar transport system permease subunit
MRLDRAREYEIAQRKGSTLRTIVQTIWLFISFVLAYYVSQWLFAERIITYHFIYSQFSVPSAVPPWAIQGALMLLIVIVMQLFILIGFFIGTPRGRAKSGRASAYSDNPDPFDTPY